jgi:phosphatidylglycerophosphate synthase
MASIPLRHMRHLPFVLTLIRGALGPTVIALAYLWPERAALVSCVVGAFLTDIFDGVIARRIGVATPALRRLDSVADSVFYVSALWAVWVLHPAVILENALLLILLAGLEAARYVFDLIKFGREASYHMWSSKLWGISLFVAFSAVFALKDPGSLPAIAIILGIVADLEGLAISFALRSWQHDVPTLFHAMRMRHEQHAV